MLTSSLQTPVMPSKKLGKLDKLNRIANLLTRSAIYIKCHSYRPQFSHEENKGSEDFKLVSENPAVNGSTHRNRFVFYICL